MIDSTSSACATASADAVGYFEKSGIFTWRTARSVVCAERIVRISTSNGAPWQTLADESHACGYCCKRSEYIFSASGFFMKEWGRADSNRRQSVPNALGWTRLPYYPVPSYLCRERKNT